MWTFHVPDDLLQDFLHDANPIEARRNKDLKLLHGSMISASHVQNLMTLGLGNTYIINIYIYKSIINI